MSEALQLVRGEGGDPAEPQIIAVSAAMHRAVTLAMRYAAAGLPVLLIGETGTGKEVLAQAIHRWSGLRGPMVDLNCGSLHSETAVNEILGHRRGAYTGATESVAGFVERADGGTLFLDELDSLPPEGQRALLRTLETGEVRRQGDHLKRRVTVRLISAIHHAEPGPSRGGSVRADLIHRLAVGVIQLSPLRERPEDLWPLAVAFARQVDHQVAESVRAILHGYHWPGNVRELRNVIQRASSLCDSRRLGPDDVSESIALAGILPSEPATGSMDTSDRERLLLLAEACGHDIERLAVALGQHRSTVYRRLKRLGIRLPRIPDPGSAVAFRRATKCD